MQSNKDLINIHRNFRAQFPIINGFTIFSHCMFVHIHVHASITTCTEGTGQLVKVNSFHFL